MSRTLYLPVRVLSLSELDAFCYDGARKRHDIVYGIEKVSRSRVTVRAFDGARWTEAVFPCYPGPDGVRVVLDPMRFSETDGARAMFAPLLEGTL